MPEGCLVRSVAGRATCAILWPLLSGVEAIVLASCVCHRQPRRRSVLVLARVTAVVPPFLAVGARAVCWLALDRCLRWAQQTSVVDPVVLGGPRLGHLLSRRVAGGYRLRAGQLQLPPRPRLVAGGGGAFRSRLCKRTVVIVSSAVRRLSGRERRTGGWASSR